MALINAGFEPRFLIADNAYLSRENWDITQELTGGRGQLHTPLRGRNFDPRTHLPRGVASRVEKFNRENPDLADELVRTRSVIEGLFATEKGHGGDNRLYTAGSKAERQQRAAIKHQIAVNPKAAADPDLRWLESRSGMYTSRINEMHIRIIRQVLRRTVAMEMLYNRRISYRRLSKFGPVREIVPEDAA